MAQSSGTRVLVTGGTSGLLAKRAFGRRYLYARHERRVPTTLES